MLREILLLASPAWSLKQWQGKDVIAFVIASAIAFVITFVIALVIALVAFAGTSCPSSP